MNENTLLNGIALAIKKVPFEGDHVHYLWNVNMVLNRAKEYINSLLPPEERSAGNSLQITIKGSLTIEYLCGTSIITRHTPHILTVYGVRSLNEKHKELAEPFSCSMDITDFFHWEAAGFVKENYGVIVKRVMSSENNNELSWINRHPAVDPDQHGINITTEQYIHGTRELTLLMSARLNEGFVQKLEQKLAKNWDSGVGSPQPNKVSELAIKEYQCEQDNWFPLPKGPGRWCVGFVEQTTVLYNNKEEQAIIGNANRYISMYGFLYRTTGIIVGVGLKQLSVWVGRNDGTIEANFDIPSNWSAADIDCHLKYIKESILSDMYNLLLLKSRRRRCIIRALNKIDDDPITQYPIGENYRLVKHRGRYRVMRGNTIACDVDCLEQLTIDHFKHLDRLKNIA
jgi:hypothetical protein